MMIIHFEEIKLYESGFFILNFCLYINIHI